MKLLHGNNLDLLRAMPDNSVHAIVCDPPYGLGKEPDALAMLRDWIETGHHDVKSKSGFMGKTWDNFVPQPVQWRECLRVLKPGGHLLAFAGTRTQDLVALGLRLAGFEIRDLVAWVYGQGFPKSANVGCKCGGGALPYTHEEKLPRKPKTECDLHPVHDTNVSPPGDSSEGGGQVLQSGVPESGAPITRRSELPPNEIRQRQPRMEGRGDLLEEEGKLQADQIRQMPLGVSTDGAKGRIHHGASPDNGADDGAVSDAGRGCPSSESRSPRQQPEELRAIPEQQVTQEGGRRTCPTCKGIIGAEGFGTALKPALEPITLARKPLGGTVAANVLKWHTGALNVDGCRVDAAGADLSRVNNVSLGSASGGIYGKAGAFTSEGSALGRWPANLIHDGSDDVTGMFPDTKSGKAAAGGHKRTAENMAKGSDVYGGGKGISGTSSTDEAGTLYGDSGSAARFFYAAKVSAKERNEGLEHLPDHDWQGDGAAVPERENRPFNPSKNHHPTVKPIALMRYLCRLITPPGGTVLDPWMGSGSTGKAAALEGFDFIGMEQDAEYFRIAQARCGVKEETFDEEGFWG
jgi:DNA modification methylase